MIVSHKKTLPAFLPVKKRAHFLSLTGQKLENNYHESSSPSTPPPPPSRCSFSLRSPPTNRPAALIPPPPPPPPSNSRRWAEQERAIRFVSPAHDFLSKRPVQPPLLRVVFLPPPPTPHPIFSHPQILFNYSSPLIPLLLCCYYGVWSGCFETTQEKEHYLLWRNMTIVASVTNTIIFSV